MADLVPLGTNFDKRAWQAEYDARRRADPAWKARHKDWSAEYHKRRWAEPEWRAKRKAQAQALQREKIAFIQAYKAERGCVRCEESEPVCLDLHHREPGGKHTKLRNGTSLYQLGWDAIKTELEKCDVMCANCHR